MGYTTDFTGELKLSKNLTPEQFNFINKLNETRRMKRDVNKLKEIYKGKYGLPDTSIDFTYGKEGEYFVGGEGFGGQDRDDSIIDYNTPPNQVGLTSGRDFTDYWNETQRRIRNGDCQPSLWLGWKIEEMDGEHYLMWDGGEKFYYYVEWLEYLIYHFFSTWDINLNGEIEWKGEESEDIGKIVVKDNYIKVGVGKITYEYQ